ncbi:hypothetical protein SISSUDRAFT_1068145 [Sistotremastrum suecicum HHB10207 ss-3]|uniref:Uncharacterized protein n=1 Tax=Sistotremastrum suecicum HHB10207 ss-3 TaxID=1314776 RepID=A0A165WEY6_9AGAM|nr:hypothetical protein SISSUDRAFT_1068145 [Sistotremastrum suecicum HHB10207 ss-3]
MAPTLRNRQKPTANLPPIPQPTQPKTRTRVKDRFFYDEAPNNAEAPTDTPTPDLQATSQSSTESHPTVLPAKRKPGRPKSKVTSKRLKLTQVQGDAVDAEVNAEMDVVSPATTVPPPPRLNRPAPALAAQMQRASRPSAKLSAVEDEDDAYTESPPQSDDENSPVSPIVVSSESEAAHVTSARRAKQKKQKTRTSASNSSTTAASAPKAASNLPAHDPAPLEITIKYKDKNGLWEKSTIRLFGSFENNNNKVHALLGLSLSDSPSIFFCYNGSKEKNAWKSEVHMKEIAGEWTREHEVNMGNRKSKFPVVFDFVPTGTRTGTAAAASVAKTDIKYRKISHIISYHIAK